MPQGHECHINLGLSFIYFCSRCYLSRVEGLFNKQLHWILSHIWIYQPLIPCLYLRICAGSKEGWHLCPLLTEPGVGNALNRSPVHLRVTQRDTEKTTLHAHIMPKGNLQRPIKLVVILLDCRWKLEYMERKNARGEHVNSMQRDHRLR